MAKKSSSKSGRKYGKAASRSVERALHRAKRGKLKSGGSGRTVTNPKQAIAIGLSEAREKGAKVPPPKKRAKKKSAKKSARTSRKPARKSTAARRERAAKK